MILTSGRCRKTFLLPLGQSTATDELFPAPFSLIPLLATQPACTGSQPPWDTLGHHLGMVWPAAHVQVRGVHPCGEAVVRVGPVPAGVQQVRR